MTGAELYALYVRKLDEVMSSDTDPWDDIEADWPLWNAMADAIGSEFDPSANRAALLERAESAECVIRQAANDTFGEELIVKEFAERSGYDS